MAFESGVNAPGGMSYAAPLMQFQQFANWKADDPYVKIFNEQQKSLNEQRIMAAQRQSDIAQTFKGGLPTDPATGAIDYKKAVAMLAQKGDTGALWNGADAVLTQGAASLSPLLMGGAQPAQPRPQGVAPSAPISLPAKPLSPPVANSPQGDPGQGSITSMVTDRLPNQDATTGQTIVKIAQTMGVDPNATLTPGQLRRAQGLMQRYAPATPVAPAATAAHVAAPVAQPAAGPSFKDRFASTGEDTRLPPSANAVTPAAKVASQATEPAPIGAPAAPTATPSAVPAAAPVQQAAKPITPQVPLPNGFDDPQSAIRALRTEAARMSANPKAAGQVTELRSWADRIEASIAPVEVNPNTTRIDPRTGNILYQGPAAAAIEASAHATASPTLDADAERYRQTGQLPPNLSKNLMGQAESKAIRDRATAIEMEAGGNPQAWPQKWQEFKAAQVAVQRFQSGKQGDTVRSFNVLVHHLDTLSEAANALKNGDYRTFNSWKQTWAANTGGTAPTNFDGVKALVGDEIVKAVVGSAGALADREEVKKDLSRASSPKQLAELVENYKKLALGQLNGLKKQYEMSTKRTDFNQMLLPGTLKALGGHDGGHDGKTAPDKDGWVTVTLPGGKTARVQEVK
ncbi:MAG: hypothetical protein PS018_20280 [bacterium]|nr:hypothetical protein [bacterium]